MLCTLTICRLSGIYLNIAYYIQDPIGYTQGHRSMCFNSIIAVIILFQNCCYYSVSEEKHIDTNSVPTQGILYEHNCARLTHIESI